MTTTQPDATGRTAEVEGAGRARVLIYYRAPSDDPDVIERSYRETSRALANTPGLLRNELLRDAAEPDSYVILSEWESLAAFRQWEEGPTHRGRTSPMRPYQDRGGRSKHYGIYEVTAVY